MLGARMPRRRALAAWAALLSLACGADERGSHTASAGAAAARNEPAIAREGPATARWDTVDAIRASLAATHGPADGGGRAWLVRDGQPPYAVAATPDRFTLVYEAGPEGVATGGMVYLQVSPFWDWSTPQVVDPEARGYTEVRGSDPALRLEPETLDQQLLGIRVAGRPMAAGDRITIVYGAGLAGAMVDRYAERSSPFWFAVDGDGDGTRKLIDAPPVIDVRPGPAATLLMHVPTVVRPGERFRVTLAFVDAWRNTGVDVKGDVHFEELPAGLELPASVRFEPDHAGRRVVEGVARKPGVYRLRARAANEVVRSNPMVVSAEGPRVYWGDLHGHSSLSDGTGVPQDYFVYARDVSALDVAALTDHDHWGMQPLYAHPELWAEIERRTREFHAPGRFVTLLGYEWTSWIHGHRHVLYFQDAGPVFPWSDPKYESPTQLWRALEGQRALTFAHHSAGGPIAVNWAIPPDPRFEPVTEIVSIHGSSEAADTPNPIGRAVSGHYVRDALGHGYQLGFIGSGDHHDGHPGAYQVDPPMGGLAAILADELTRDGVEAALRARRVYATNGPRILLRFALGEHRMGEVVRVGPGGELSGPLLVQVIAETPLAAVELVRSGELVDGVALDGQLEVTLDREIQGLAPGEYVYVRAIQQDQGAAWSSPIYVTE
jgi:hypothetical protein